MCIRDSSYTLQDRRAKKTLHFPSIPNLGSIIIGTHRTQFMLDCTVISLNSAGSLRKWFRHMVFRNDYPGVSSFYILWNLRVEMVWIDSAAIIFNGAHLYSTIEVWNQTELSTPSRPSWKFWIIIVWNNCAQKFMYGSTEVSLSRMEAAQLCEIIILYLEKGASTVQKKITA